MKLWEGIKNVGKNAKTYIRDKWHTGRGRDKVKMIVGGISMFGCGYAGGKIADKLIDKKDPFIAKAGIWTASYGLSLAAGIVADEALGAGIDALVDTANGKIWEGDK